MAEDTDLTFFSEGQALLDAAEAAKQGKAPAQKKPASKPASRASTPAKKPAAKKPPAKKRTPAKKPAAKGKGRAKKQAGVPAAGMVTRGIGAGVRGFAQLSDGGQRLGIGGAAAGFMLLCVIIASVISLDSVPPKSPVSAISFGEIKVPKPLQKRWLSQYPHCRELFAHPSEELLYHFEGYLQKLPAVAAVNEVSLEWLQDPTGQREPSRRLLIDLALRTPVLKVFLANGNMVYVDKEGVILPPELPGPDGKPVVRGWESGGKEALLEVLEAWPLLEQRMAEARIPAGAIKEIHLNASLSRPGQRGIVFIANNSKQTRILWGEPGEARFGVSVEDKLRNFIHGWQHFNKSSEINLRFHGDAFAVVRP